MDWLLEIEAEIAEVVYWATATLLNLEVDLLFFDTTSTYFETDEADPPTPAAPKGFRTFGHSKDHRSDLPQVVIGLAVTRTGIPIRVWTFPGNTADMALIRGVKDDLLAWKLGRVVWVTDRGFASAQNRRYLGRAGGHYISGEKLRSESAEATAALARQGRYQVVAGNLEVKEVVLDEGVMRDRFVVCRNPDEAVRDGAIRDRLLGGLEAAIAEQRRARPRGAREARLRPAGDAHQPPLPADHEGRAPAHRPGGGPSRCQARRQVPPAHERPDALRRGRGDRVQAAPRGRAGLAGHEDDP